MHKNKLQQCTKVSDSIQVPLPKISQFPSLKVAKYLNLGLLYLSFLHQAGIHESVVQAFS